MFRIGDIVVTRDEREYKYKYSIITAENNFVGKVISIGGDSLMEVEVIFCDLKSFIGNVYEVEQKYFELKSNNLRTLKRLRGEV